MRSKVAAFTLMEILVVCVILAIAAMIAVPSMASGFDSVRVPSAARMVMSDILLAQNTAITTQNKTYIYFIKDERNIWGYTIVRFKSGTAPTAPSLDEATRATGQYTNTSTVIFVMSPNAKRGCYVAFGGNPSGGPPGGTGPMSQTLLGANGTTSVTSFGFDSLGEPIDTSSGAQLVAELAIPVSNLQAVSGVATPGTVTTTLAVAPITGEISVK